MDLRFFGAKLGTREGFDIARGQVMNHIEGYKEGLALDSLFSEQRQRLSDDLGSKLKNLNELFNAGSKISRDDIKEVENAERILAMAHFTRKDRAVFADSNLQKGKNASGQAISEAKKLRLMTGMDGDEDTRPLHRVTIHAGFGKGPL